MNKDMIFYQLFEPETSTYTYLLADAISKEAILIDTVLEKVEREQKLISELGLKLKYILDTHVHADHITGAAKLRESTGAQTALCETAPVECVDKKLKDGETLSFGQFEIKGIQTHGHTDTCMSYYCEGMVFTGDTLLIRGCGRTDFQSGNSETLFESVRERLFALPDETLVYPGHDYRGVNHSTIGDEKKWNPRLNLELSKEDFVKLMSELDLANPKKIHEAVPANLQCGDV